MSILNSAASAMQSIFNPTPEQLNPQPAPAQPGNLPAEGAVTTSTPAAAPNGVLPNPEVTSQEPKDNSPLAAFKDLWEDVPTDPNAPPSDTGPVPLKQEDVAAAVNKIDFSKSITPEIMTAITEGGEGAMAALVGVINSVGRDSLTQATLVSNQLAQKAIDRALEQQSAQLPNLVRDATVSAHLKDTNPIFDNPAIKPVIEATRQQLLLKNPTATPAEITKMTNSYILAMGDAFAPKIEPVKVAGEQDWSTYLQ